MAIPAIPRMVRAIT